MSDQSRRHHGGIWTPDAEDELRHRAGQGQFLPEIAAAMGRSQEAIRTRANKLHIPVRSAAERRYPKEQPGDEVAPVDPIL